MVPVWLRSGADWVRHLDIEVDDALEVAQQTVIRKRVRPTVIALRMVDFGRLARRHWEYRFGSQPDLQSPSTQARTVAMRQREHLRPSRTGRGNLPCRTIT